MKKQGRPSGRPPASGGGDRVVHGDKELIEKLGRNDLCPCGSGRRFQDLPHAHRPLRRQRTRVQRWYYVRD
jgi:hypothetical protein